MRSPVPTYLKSDLMSPTPTNTRATDRPTDGFAVPPGSFPGAKVHSVVGKCPALVDVATGACRPFRHFRDSLCLEIGYTDRRVFLCYFFFI